MSAETRSAGFASLCEVDSEARRNCCQQILEQVREQNLETIRVSFADQHGILRGKVIVAADLAAALENGLAVTSTLLLKDTSHGTVFPVWGDDAGFGRGVLTGASDLVMLPDVSTFKVLPWSEHNGWILADLYTADGSPVRFSTRQILQSAVSRLTDAGFRLICGLEVEFAVYRMLDPNLGHHHSGKPQDPPDTELLAHGYQYLTEQHYDQLEPVMDLVRRNAQLLGLPVRSMEVEFGPSQFEMTFHPGDAMTVADNMMLFRSMVKQVCSRQGFHATFMCRPRLQNAMGNGWHLHQSVTSLASGVNQFIPAAGDNLSPLAGNWVAGLLGHAGESCLLTTPTINGYKRYQPFALAPDRVQWGRDNRGAMVRALCAPGNNASRVENRVGESAANPYLYLASQLLTGLDGVENNLQPPDPVETPYNSDAEKLPGSLLEALLAFENSGFYRRVLGDEFVDYYATIKRAEWQRYTRDVSEWEHREYFSLY